MSEPKFTPGPWMVSKSESPRFRGMREGAKYEK